MGLALKFFFVFVLLFSQTLGASVPTRASRSIDEPLARGYKRHTARENALHLPVGRETNAQRLRRGLPPLPPHFKAHRASDAKRTPTVSASQAYPSASSSPVSGQIYVYGNSGEYIGLVSRSPKASDVQRFGLTSDSHRAMSITSRTPSDVIPASLTITNPEDGFVKLGFVTGAASADSKLSRRSVSYAVLSGVDETPRWQPPMSARSAYGSGAVESTIWTYDGRTHILTPHWINPDGSPAVTQLLYLPEQDALLVTGCEDVDAMEDAFGEAAVPVFFKLA